MVPWKTRLPLTAQGVRGPALDRRVSAVVLRLSLLRLRVLFFGRLSFLRPVLPSFPVARDCEVVHGRRVYKMLTHVLTSFVPSYFPTPDSRSGSSRGGDILFLSS